MKNLNFCFLKDIKRTKKDTDWQETLVKCESDKGLEKRAYTEFSKFNNTETTQLKHEEKTELSVP